MVFPLIPRLHILDGRPLLYSQISTVTCSSLNIGTDAYGHCCCPFSYIHFHQHSMLHPSITAHPILLSGLVSNTLWIFLDSFMFCMFNSSFCSWCIISGAITPLSIWMPSFLSSLVTIHNSVLVSFMLTILPVKPEIDQESVSCISALTHTFAS